MRLFQTRKFDPAALRHALRAAPLLGGTPTLRLKALLLLPPQLALERRRGLQLCLLAFLCTLRLHSLANQIALALHILRSISLQGCRNILQDVFRVEVQPLASPICTPPSSSAKG